MPSAETTRSRTWPLWWLATCSLLLVTSEASISASGTLDAGFDVRKADTRLDNGVYYVDADIGLDFSDEAMEALDNGVPLTLLLEVRLLRRRAVWDERIARIETRYRIQTHALTKHFVVRNLNSGESHTYESFQEMVAGVGTLRGFPVIDAHLLEDGEDYELRMRLSLDIEALPSPLRPMAYLSSLWRLDSDWYTWPIQR